MLWMMPQQLFAIPPAIARIVRIFEGGHKQKGIKPKDGQARVVSGDDQANELQTTQVAALSNVEQARLAIDEAIKNSKLAKHPATWYYRGVIYDRLLRDHVAQPSTFLNEVLAAYAQAKKLSASKSKQFYSFSVENLIALWRYFLNRGMGYYRQEAVDQAIEHFAICRRILPEEPTPLLYMAIVYHSADQPEEALRYYQDYLAVDGPQFAVARAMAAIHYHKLKNFDKAMAILDEALRQFPFNNELLEEKCLIHQAAGSIDGYAASLAVDLQHKGPHLCYAYAYVLQHQGRIQEAIGYYEQLLKDHPAHYEALRQMGFIFYNEAIKLYAYTLKSMGSKTQLDDVALADWCGLMHVTVRRFLANGIGWTGSNYVLFRGGVLQEPLFAARPIWVVYDHPLVQHSSSSSLRDLLQAGNLPYASPLYGYIHAKNSAALTRNKWAQTMVDLEKYLKKSLYYLKIARAQDKKDKAVAQALYYSYYHLKKYGAAYRVLQRMQKQKQYLEDDPFRGNQEKE